MSKPKWYEECYYCSEVGTLDMALDFLKKGKTNPEP